MNICERRGLCLELMHTDIGKPLTDSARSLSMEGTCNWAQPGRIKRFLKFVKQEKQVAPELPLFATAVPLLRRKLGLESPIEKLD